jgi:hypothetical protein
MNKFTYASIAVAAVIGAGLTFELVMPTPQESELRRVECQALTMFTPSRSKSADELCENYGGVALKECRAEQRRARYPGTQPAGWGVRGQSEGPITSLGRS